ncbi:hypothetical protein BDP67DRAFT_487566 [Colletotrichum lupini]|nr:hypothetical protein BDP67DRAFT_487566 [Colletotrichum lupini]
MVNPWSSLCGLEPSLQSTCWLGNRQGVMAVLQHYLMPDYTCYTVVRASIVNAALRYNDGTVGTGIRPYSDQIPSNRRSHFLQAQDITEKSWMASIALPVTRGCNARLMSWGKGYLEPYHAATRYDLDPSHASPAFVQKANTGKMNKEGNVDRLEGFRRGRGQCYLMHMASRKPHDARCTPLPKFSNRVVLERRDEAGLCLIHEPAQVNVTLQSATATQLLCSANTHPAAAAIQRHHHVPLSSSKLPFAMASLPCACAAQPIRRHGDGVQRWEGNVATLRLPLRSVALGTAVAGIRCDVASCFHSCASEEERKMRLCDVGGCGSTYGSILEASKKAKKEFTLLRRCSKFEVCSSFANQNSRKFSPPPGIQRQVPAQPGPRQGKTRVSRHRGKGMMCLGVLGYRYLRCVIHRSLLDARGPFLFPDGGHEQDGWGEPKGTGMPRPYGFQTTLKYG